MNTQTDLSLRWRIWSDCMNTQTDLSLRWPHIQSCRKCYVPVFPTRLHVCQVKNQMTNTVSYIYMYAFWSDASSYPFYVCYHKINTPDNYFPCFLRQSNVFKGNISPDWGHCHSYMYFRICVCLYIVFGGTLWWAKWYVRKAFFVLTSSQKIVWIVVRITLVRWF